MWSRFPRLSCSVALAILAAIGQSSPSKAADLASDQAHISFQTDEGTRINLDVSPDGTKIVLDLLGDIYLLPVSGGTAQPLLEGLAWDRNPRWSPDGRQIAFLSDREGASNVWVLTIASRHLRRLTTYHGSPKSDLFGVPGTAFWLDNMHIGFSEPGTGALKSVHTGTGTVQPVYLPKALRGGAASTIFAASRASASGLLYFGVQTTSVEPGASRPYANSLSVYDSKSGSARRLTAMRPGLNEFSPLVSQSGRLLAYGRKVGLAPAELRLRDLNTGRDIHLTTLTRASDPASSGHWAEDALPSYAFTPDERWVVLWVDGKIYRVAITGDKVEPIPFSVQVKRTIAAPALGRSSVAEGPLRVRALRWPSLERNGGSLLFSAVGSIWLCDSAGARPRRLTRGDKIETMPARSSDGRQVAYVEYENAGGTLSSAKLMLLDLTSGKITTLLTGDANYAVPAFSPDGSRIALVRETRGPKGVEAQFGWLDLKRSSFHAVAQAAPPSLMDFRGAYAQGVHFDADGTHLLVTTGSLRYLDGAPLQLRIVPLSGGAPQILAQAAADVAALSASPDLRHLLLIGWDFHPYLVPMPTAAGTLVSTRALTPISRAFAAFPDWIDAATLSFGNLDRIHRLTIDGTEKVREVTLEIPRRANTDVYAVRNARLITMAGTSGGGVIEHGTLLIRGNRIAAVGPNDAVAVPAGTQVIDASGKTIIPGLVESHIHSSIGIPGATTTGYPINAPKLSIGLAYGVTTAWDAFGTYDDAALAAIELVEAGRVPGGRWFEAGGGFASYVENGGAWNSERGVADLVAHQAEKGVIALKNNHMYQRDAQQWWVSNARKHRMSAIGHAENAQQLLSAISDGVLVDHFPLPFPAYRDVIQWLRQSGTIWTVHAYAAGSTNGGPQGAGLRSLLEAMRQNPVQWAKLQRLAPNFLEEAQKIPYRPFEQTESFKVDRVAAELIRTGGKVVSSADTHDMEGQITLHMEMWGLARAGVDNASVLRSATIVAAEKLGLKNEIGSLEVGKLADYVILNSDPLINIENTLDINFTSVSGIFYDGDGQRTFYGNR